MNRSVDLNAVAGALRSAGVRTGNLRLLNTGRTLVVADAEKVIRITDADHEQTEREIRTTLLLVAAGAPVLAPLEPGVTETILGAVTTWPLAEKTDRPEQDLGTTLRELHQVNVVLAYGQTTNRTKVRRMAMELEKYGVDAETTEALRALVTTLPEECTWRGDTGQVVLHGDAHRGNIMRRGGRPVLIDSGGAQVGPWQLDLVPTWAAARRSRDGWGNWQQLKDNYDPGKLAGGLWDWSHLQEAVLERELMTTLFLARMWRRAPWVREEIGTRLESWWDHSRPWNTGTDAGR